MGFGDREDSYSMIKAEGLSNDLHSSITQCERVVVKRALCILSCKSVCKSVCVCAYVSQ